jgi:hypothetical protein
LTSPALETENLLWLRIDSPLITKVHLTDLHIKTINILFYNCHSRDTG